MKTKKFFRKTVFMSVILAVLMVSYNSAFAQCGASHNHDASSNSTKSVDNTNSVEVLYVCSMHPEITSKEAGYCSKCGMALVNQSAVSENHDMKMMCDMNHDSKDNNKQHKHKMMMPLMGISMGIMMVVMMFFVVKN
jgi:hypothetical protein